MKKNYGKPATTIVRVAAGKNILATSFPGSGNITDEEWEEEIPF